MASKALQEGDRVRVVHSYSWAQGALATVIHPPQGAIAIAADNYPWEGLSRKMKGRRRMLEFYFVKFDELHRDADDDGPYWGGAIEVEALELLEDIDKE